MFFRYLYVLKIDFLIFTIFLISYLAPSQELNIVGLVIFLVFILKIYIFDSKKIILIFSYFFPILVSLGSAFYIEFKEKIFLYEISEYSSFENTFIKFLFLVYIILRLMFFLIKNPKFKYKKIKYKFLFLVLFFILLIFTFSIEIYYKPSFILGVDRFYYEVEILGSKISKLTNLLYYFSIGLGLLYSQSKNKIYLLLFFLSLLTFLLKGHKFGNFFHMTVLFLIPIIIYESNKLSKKYLKRIFFLVILLVGIGVSINAVYSKSNDYNPMIYLESRLMQQNQLWWAIVQKKEFLEFHLKNLSNEIIYGIFKEENLKFKIGIYKAMELVTPSNVFTNKILSNSRYTGGFFPILYYYFNYNILILFSIIIGILVGFVYKIMIYSIYTQNLILTILSTRLLYFIQTIQTGDIYKLFSLELFIEITILLISIMFIRKKNV
jgi:hypothetical protein